MNQGVPLSLQDVDGLRATRRASVTPPFVAGKSSTLTGDQSGEDTGERPGEPRAAGGGGGLLV